MTKNNCLLLIFPKTGGFIFIFAIIVVYLLTTVSKTAFGENNTILNLSAKIETFSGKDTVISIFKEDFESGNLSGWKQTDDWEVSASEKIAGNFSLKHLSKPISGNSSLFHNVSADLNLVDLEWAFTFKNGKWDPSSSNRFLFYLTADTIVPDLINGYAVGVNISGTSDLLNLWRIRKGKADSLIVQTDMDWNGSNLATINVKRTTRGKWTLNYLKSGETNLKSFSGTDRSQFSFKNIGITFKYTATRSGQLWIDDVSVSQLAAELFIQELAFINPHSILLTFNKPINPASVRSGNFILTDENNRNISVTQAKIMAGSDNSIELSFGNVDGIELRLSVSGISDLSGKIISPEIRTFSYSFSPEVGTILINEILFNPFSGGVDFVELVNVSEVPVPIHRLKLASRNDTLALKQIYPVSTEERYLYPGQFLVCTKDSAIVAAQYFTSDPETFCLMKTLPSYSDDAGTVVLLNDSLEVIDEFSYSAKMHSTFLADENGVSLERISLEKPTSDRSNWASAASSVGFATPGLPNSQIESETEIQDEITPEPKVFSPNGDGHNDELTIKYSFGKPGYIANVRIFDAIGRQVKFITKNESLAQAGSWLWNGESDSGQELNLGVFIILVEVFDEDGQVKRFKKTCTIVDRLE
ncbi:MAG: gliding motility-associated C-terminal domain-containing protein [Prolixibacteraceae bacterium]|nr:gliding motility-associated C-terminal domain-containing protein [Prolixibacteraceae bacterium]